MTSYSLYWAVNQARRGRRWHPQREGLPFGRTFPYPQYRATVECVEPTHVFMCAASCSRRAAPKWHNRVHIARVRWIATSTIGAGVLEYGVGACGGYLVNPLYVDEPTRLCDCGGEATICPRCRAVAAIHATG